MRCPNCHDSHTTKTADSRGHHYHCTDCGYRWTPEVEFVTEVPGTAV